MDGSGHPLFDLRQYCTNELMRYCLKSQTDREDCHRSYCSRFKRLLSEGGGFAPAGGVRSLNRRGRGPLVSADSFGFLFVATGDESLTPQRAFRSLSLRFRLPPLADSPLASRRPLETFGAVLLLLYFICSTVSIGPICSPSLSFTDKRTKKCALPLDVRMDACYNNKAGSSWRDGRAVDGAGLENQ